MRKFYRVLDPHAKTIGKHPVEDGKVYLTESEAEHWLRIGAIAEIPE
jgi:hypothetical protein